MKKFRHGIWEIEMHCQEGSFYIALYSHDWLQPDKNNNTTELKKIFHTQIMFSVVTLMNFNEKVAKAWAATYDLELAEKITEWIKEFFSCAPNLEDRYTDKQAATTPSNKEVN